MTVSKALRIGVAAAVLVMAAGIRPSFAGAIISHGGVTLGVWETANLDLVQGSNPAVGIQLAGVGDGINADALWEGWGVGVVLAGSGDQVAGGASVDLPLPSSYNLDNPYNIDVHSFTTDATSTTNGTFATSVVDLAAGADLRVTHDYQGAYVDSQGGALFRATITFQNTGTTDYTSLLYRRVMDWDIPPPPTGHDEFVTIYGGTARRLAPGDPGNLIFTNDNQNDSVDPFEPSQGDMAGCGENVDFVDCPNSGLPGGQGFGHAEDHGAHFDFELGNLAAGQSKTFQIYYGATYTEAAAYLALQSVGAEVFSLGQSNTVGGPELGTPGTWIFAASGVGGEAFVAPVPEPASLLMFGTGLTGLAALVRKRRAAAKAVAANG